MGEDYRKSSAVNMAEGALWGLGVAMSCAVWWGFLVWVDDARFALLPLGGFFVWAIVVVARDRIRRRRS